MKIIKTYENYNLEDLDLGRFYKIISRSKLIPNDDGSYDYNGDLNFNYNKIYSLSEIPIKFKNVYGNFRLDDNYLISLEGSPEFVYGDFRCNFNQLISLQYLPKIIQGDVICGDNPLLSKKHLSDVKGNIIFEGSPNTTINKTPYQLDYHAKKTVRQMTFDKQMAELKFFDENDLEASKMFQDILDHYGVEYGTYRNQMKGLIKGNDNLKALGY